MSLPWFAHDIAAYNRKTRGLSMLQDGAYRRLLDHYYDTEAPLPAPLSEVFLIARCASRADRDAVTFVLKRFFTLEDDGWHNGRADDELAAAREIIEAKSEAGKAGAKARWNSKRNASANSKRMAGAQQKHKQNDATLTLTDTGVEPDGSKQSADAPFVLPDWVPKLAWDEFIKSRKGLKATPTDHAKDLLVKDLAKLKEQGFSPGEILETATKNSWKGLYPPSPQRYANGSGHSEKRSTTDQHLAGIASLVSDIRAGRG
jgi:uncharacterized protein YdaU (DUF1376 family)